MASVNDPTPVVTWTGDFWPPANGPVRYIRVDCADEETRLRADILMYLWVKRSAPTSVIARVLRDGPDAFHGYLLQAWPGLSTDRVRAVLGRMARDGLVTRHAQSRFGTLTGRCEWSAVCRDGAP
jgi:hypothetical protein